MGNAEGIPQLPMSCLAEFVTRGRRNPESVLRPFKFRELAEGKARIIFRPPLLGVIRRFYRSGRKVEVLQEAAAAWQEMAEASDKKAVRSRHRSNIKSLEFFWRRFADREFEIMPMNRTTCTIEQIVFTATPDLWAKVKGRELLIKFGFAKRKRSYAEVIVLVMRRAALLQGHRVRQRDAIYMNVSTGEQITAGFTFRQAALTLSNAAKEIAKVWPRISRLPTPPSPFAKRAEPATIRPRH